MKKVFLSCLMMLFLTGTAFAGGIAKDNTGCGLGTILWKNKADNSTISQVLQATTNGTFGTQTFGITTGTLDCKEPSSFVRNDKLNEFVLANMDNLAKEIAMGHGEILETLAELIGVEAPKRAEFYARLKANFTMIFSSEKVELADVVDGIIAAYSGV